MEIRHIEVPHVLDKIVLLVIILSRIPLIILLNGRCGGIQGNEEFIETN